MSVHSGQFTTFVFQGYTGITVPENANDGLHFLPYTTFCALKSGHQKWTNYLDKKGHSREHQNIVKEIREMKEITDKGNSRELQNIIKEITIIQKSIEKVQAK